MRNANDECSCSNSLEQDGDTSRGAVALSQEAYQLLESAPVPSGFRESVAALSDVRETPPDFPVETIHTEPATHSVFYLGDLALDLDGASHSTPGLGDFTLGPIVSNLAPKGQ